MESQGWDRQAVGPSCFPSAPGIGRRAPAAPFERIVDVGEIEHRGRGRSSAELDRLDRGFCRHARPSGDRP